MVVMDYPVPKPKRNKIVIDGKDNVIITQESESNLGRFFIGLLWGWVLGVPFFYLIKSIIKGIF